MHIVGFALILLFNSFSAQAKEVVNKIVGTVNSEIILQSDFKKLQSRIEKSGAVDETLLLGEKISSLKNNKRAQLDFLVREKLVESEIKRQNFSVTDDRVESELNMMAKKNQLSRAEFDRLLLKQGFTVEQYKDVLKSRIERQSFFESEIISKLRITDEDAFNEYQLKNPNYRPNVNEFTLSQIFFTNKKGGAAAAFERAQSVFTRISSGEKFEDMANRNNEAPGSSADGYLGSFKTGEFVPEIEKAISLMSADEISKPIKGPNGYHIVKLLSKKTTVDPNFLKIKEVLKASLVEKNFQRQLKNWFESKKQDAYIKTQDNAY